MRKLLGSPWLYYGLAAALIVVGVVSQLEIRVPSRPVEAIESLHELRDRESKPNVLFILIDTLRADHLGIAGYERPTSPTIDELARFGVRFTRAQSQSSWTKASMASLWLAEYPAKTGVIRYQHGIGEGATMPAEVFRDAGFRTGGIFRNGWLAANFGFAQGFELYLRPTPNNTEEQFERARKTGYEVKGTDLDATEAAIEFMRSSARQPFFLYVHYMDVHQYLYEENHAKFGTGYKDAYDNAISWTDANVAMLVAELDALGIFDDTIIVIAADHGEAFGEHGVEGHAKDVYAEVIDVPLIFSLPFRVKEPIVVNEVVRNLDIFPTIFDMIGLPPMEGVEGISLVPLIEAVANGAPTDGLAPTTAVAQLDQTWGRIGHEPEPLVGFEQDGLRVIFPAAYPGDSELYDKQADPGEMTNVASERPADVETFQGRSREYLEQKPISTLLEIEVDEMQLNQLRALGYMLEGAENEPVPRGKKNKKYKVIPKDMKH